jgi:hypothetical protein
MRGRTTSLGIQLAIPIHVEYKLSMNKSKLFN